jgi:hypothetical protein
MVPASSSTRHRIVVHRGGDGGERGGHVGENGDVERDAGCQGAAVAERQPSGAPALAIVRWLAVSVAGASGPLPAFAGSDTPPLDPHAATVSARIANSAIRTDVCASASTRSPTRANAPRSHAWRKRSAFSHTKLHVADITDEATTEYYALQLIQLAATELTGEDAYAPTISKSNRLYHDCYVQETIYDHPNCKQGSRYELKTDASVRSLRVERA